MQKNFRLRYDWVAPIARRGRHRSVSACESFLFIEKIKTEESERETLLQLKVIIVHSACKYLVISSATSKSTAAHSVHRTSNMSLNKIWRSVHKTNNINNANRIVRGACMCTRKFYLIDSNDIKITVGAVRMLCGIPDVKKIGWFDYYCFTKHLKTEWHFTAGGVFSFDCGLCVYNVAISNVFWSHNSECNMYLVFVYQVRCVYSALLPDFN